MHGRQFNVDGDVSRFSWPSLSETLSPVMISLFPTSIDLDPIFEKDRDLDWF